MFNNKKNKIIFLALIMLVLSAIIIFALKNKNKLETIGDVEKIKIEEFQKNYPQISEKQLEKFEQISRDEEGAFNCLGREDEKDCIAAIASVKNDKDICYIHGHSGENEHEHGDDEEASLRKCVNNILRNGAPKEVDKCKPLNGDDFFNCLKNLFDIYDKKDDCANLLDNEARIICEELFAYEYAYLNYDRNLCAQIKYEKLNQYCLATIIDKTRDTDGDGLTDLDEINRYKTHYLFSDTDGDGHSDGEEVKNGFNPKGEGKAP